MEAVVGVFWDREHHEIYISPGCALIGVAIALAIFALVEIVDWI